MVLEQVEAVIETFYVAVVTVIGLVGLYCGVECGASALRLFRGGTTPVTDLEPGTTTTVAGRLRADDPLSAPLSGEPCVAVLLTEWTAEFGEDSVTETALDLSGLDWWEDAAATETTVAAAVPFTLRSGAEVTVDPAGADADPVPGLGRADAVPLDELDAFDLREVPETVEEPTDEDTLPERLRAFVAAHPDLRGDGSDVRRRRYLERRVPPTGELHVTGQVTSEGTDRRVTHEGTFVLSDTDAAATVRHRAGVAAILLAVGVGCLWLAAASVSAGAGVDFPRF